MYPEVWNQYDQLYALYKEKSDSKSNAFQKLLKIVTILIVIVLPPNTF